MTFLHTPAPQRPGFRKELEQQVHAAVQQHSPMSSRSSYLKFGWGLPLLGAALYGLIFTIQQNQPNTTIASLTATEVQAAVVKSISETFAELQADTIQYQRFKTTSTGGSDASYIIEDWHAGLNSIAIDTDQIAHQINSAQLNQATSATTNHTCLYAPYGTTYDGPAGSYTTEPYVCSDGTMTEPAFVESTGVDISPTTFITNDTGNDHWLVVQWNTAQPIQTDIEMKTLTVTNDSVNPYRHNNSLFYLHPTTPGGDPMERGLAQEFINQVDGTSYKQSVYIPDIDYLTKYEPAVTPEDIYFQLSADQATSVVYHYHVNTGEVTTADPNEVTSLSEDYQINSLQHQEFSSNYDIAEDSLQRLSRVQANGVLQSYSTNDQNQLVATYWIAEDTNDDNWNVLAGTYTFIVDQSNSAIVQWSFTNGFGATDTTIIEANTTLTDEPGTFFKEAHFKALLAERGVQL